MDIKFYRASQHQLKNLFEITELRITKNTLMEVGIQTCSLLQQEIGIWSDKNETVTLNEETVDIMTGKETYKYLGFEQNRKLAYTVSYKKSYQNRDHH